MLKKTRPANERSDHGKQTGLGESDGPGNYAVSVQPGTRLIAGPYVAETVPVTVEDDYVRTESKAVISYPVWSKN